MSVDPETIYTFRVTVRNGYRQIIDILRRESPDDLASDDPEMLLKPQYIFEPLLNQPHATFHRLSTQTTGTACVQLAC